ncbi:DNA protection during starvation protein [Rhodopirellula maiorica SM1]|uniref:DNA protection during starvation protein n=1 Tax=Rhodopirellula maiorica SM1 TaxID=1265738 RepID=M5RZJ4_9BACT|nr:DNA starvation/stationary phase protection protein Dps [Rhodopirellula maiorica]EMI19334.1 DNA protection during starvation protein [Rhodopirellula maiorica SM1]
MTTDTQSVFKRDILSDKKNDKVSALLQQNLVNLIDLALTLKQAHWNVVGPNFRSVHLQLDEIIETVRESSDEVAERISTLGIVPDGRPATVAESSELATYPLEFVKFSETVTLSADALKTTIDSLRSAIEKLGDLDPISEDMCIGISAALEKHLWMLQAQEVA